MTGIPGLYFVIANDAHARFVRPDPENGLHTIRVVDLAASRGCRGDEAAGSASGNGPSDPNGSERTRFIRLLGARIDEDFAVDLFTHLVLVAPPRVLRELTAMLDTSTRMSLLGSLAKDLVTVADLELWPHLLPWVRPAPIARAPPVALRWW